MTFFMVTLPGLPCENIWEYVRIYENIWEYMGIYGNIWEYMGTLTGLPCENIWEYVRIYENIWEYMGIYGNPTRATMWEPYEPYESPTRAAMCVFSFSDRVKASGFKVVLCIYSSFYLGEPAISEIISKKCESLESRLGHLFGIFCQHLGWARGIHKGCIEFRDSNVNFLQIMFNHCLNLTQISHFGSNIHYIFMIHNALLWQWQRHLFKI